MSEAVAATPAQAAPQDGGEAPATPATPAAGAAPAQSGGFFDGDGGTPQQQAAPAPADPTSIFGSELVADGKFVDGWSTKLQEMGFERLANKGMTTNDPTKFLKSLDDTIGMVGKRAPQTGLPNESWTEQDVATFRKTNGIPETPDGYELRPEQMPEGVEFSDEEVAGYAEILHKHHVPAAVAKELSAHHLGTLQKVQTEFAQGFESKVAELRDSSLETFQKEWGEGYESRFKSNQEFIRTRFDDKEIADPVVRAALSHPKIVRLIDEARQGRRSAPIPGVNGGEAPTDSMSPRQRAQKFIAENPNYMNDPDQVAWVNEQYRLDAVQRGGSRRR